MWPGLRQSRERDSVGPGGFGISEDDPVSRTWLSLAGQNSGTALHQRAHREGSRLPKGDREFEQWWENVQAVFDTVLQRFEERYVAVFRSLMAS